MNYEVPATVRECCVSVRLGGGQHNPFVAFLEAMKRIRGRSKTAAHMTTPTYSSSFVLLTLANAAAAAARCWLLPSGCLMFGFSLLFFWHFNCHKWQMHCVVSLNSAFSVPVSVFQLSAFNAHVEKIHMLVPKWLIYNECCWQNAGAPPYESNDSNHKNNNSNNTNNNNNSYLQRLQLQLRLWLSLRPSPVLYRHLGSLSPSETLSLTDCQQLAWSSWSLLLSLTATPCRTSPLSAASLGLHFTLNFAGLVC